MSSDQFSEEPLPPLRAWICLSCGAVAPSELAVACWLCGEKFEPQKRAPQADGPSRDSSAHDRRGAESGNGIVWVFLGVVAVLLCIGLAFSAPGILIALVICVIPATIRTVVAAQRDDDPATRSKLAGTFLASFVIAAAVAMASCFSFYLTFLVVCFGEVLGNKSLQEMQDASARAGTFVGLTVAIVLTAAILLGRYLAAR